MPIFFCTIPTAVNLLDAGETLAFVESIKAKALHPVLVVFDTLARSMPGGDEIQPETWGSSRATPTACEQLSTPL